MQLVKVWDQEIKGRLWTCGDIHGCYSLLMNTLSQVGFDFENDLLVAVGDLVDRGSQNLECIELLDQSWFTSIRGNHEDLCINGLGNDSFKRCHIDNGGEWFYQIDELAQLNIAKVLQELPVVLEVNHQGKKYGFVHGHIEQNDWEEFKATFTPGFKGYKAAQNAMWGRDRLNIDDHKYTTVSGVDAVFIGHTVVQHVCHRDNCYFIDIGSCFVGRLAVLDVNGLGL